MNYNIFLLFLFCLISTFIVAKDNEVCPDLTSTNKVTKTKTSKDLAPFLELKKINEEYESTNAIPVAPPPDQQMDGIPIPGLPDGCELEIRPREQHTEKKKEESVFDRNSNLNPSFKIDSVQEIKEFPITKESKKNEEAWKKKEREERTIE